MIRVAIIVGSTRPGRRAEIVARWVYDIASKRSDAEFEVVDIMDFNLRLVMGELEVADVRAGVALSLAADFQNYVTFKPAARDARPAHHVGGCAAERAQRLGGTSSARHNSQPTVQAWSDGAMA